MYLERTALLFLFSTEGRINPFHATGLFPYPLKTYGFMMLSRGYRKSLWYETGQCELLRCNTKDFRIATVQSLTNQSVLLLRLNFFYTFLLCCRLKIDLPPVIPIAVVSSNFSGR